MRIFSYPLLALFIAAMSAIIVSCDSKADKSAFLSMGDSRIFITDEGQGEAILFLHGGLMDHKMWQAQVDFLSKSYRVITLDLRGHGKSITGSAEYLQIDAIKSILDSLTIDSVHIAGHSLGAIVALDFAGVYPERTAKIVLIAPGLYGFNLNHDALLNRYNDEMKLAYEKADTALFIESFFKAWFDGHVQQDKIDRQVRNNAKEIAARTMHVNQWKYGPVFSASPVDSKKLASLKNHVLIICGSEDMEDIRMISDTLDRFIPASDKVMIQGAAHLIPMTFPDAVSEAIKSFLQ